MFDLLLQPAKAFHCPYTHGSLYCFLVDNCTSLILVIALNPTQVLEHLPVFQRTSAGP